LYTPRAKPKTEEVPLGFQLSVNGLADQVRLCADASKLRKPAFLVIDAMQTDQKSTGGEKIVAACVALIAACESANVPFDEVVWKAMNFMRDVEGPFTAHVQAIRQYARNDLRGAY
jgi:hypothetical protein